MMTIETLRKMDVSVDGKVLILMEIVEQLQKQLTEIERRHDHEDTMEMEASEQ